MIQSCLKFFSIEFVLFSFLWKDEVFLIERFFSQKPFNYFQKFSQMNACRSVWWLLKSPLVHKILKFKRFKVLAKRKESFVCGKLKPETSTYLKFTWKALSAEWTMQVLGFVKLCKWRCCKRMTSPQTAICKTTLGWVMLVEDFRLRFDIVNVISLCLW